MNMINRCATLDVCNPTLWGIIHPPRSHRIATTATVEAGGRIVALPLHKVTVGRDPPVHI